MACGKDVDSAVEILEFANKENGLMKSKKVDDISYKVKYVPRGYLAAKEAEGIGNMSKFDSLLATYKDTYTFWMTVGPNEEEGADFDIMTGTVQSIEEYKSKVLELNFEMVEYFKLQANGNEYRPVCVELENTYELTKHRKFLIGFVAKGSETEASDLDFVYHDEILGTGINHFYFRKEDVARIPRISY